MKEKTFNNLMKKTKKDLIEIIFRKDDVHTELNKKIALLEQQSALYDIAKRDLDNLSEKYSKLKDDNNSLIKDYNELSEQYSIDCDNLSNANINLVDENNHLSKVNKDLTINLKKYKFQKLILILVSMIEFIAIFILALI